LTRRAIRRTHGRRVSLCALAVSCIPLTAAAAPGFIAGSFVDGDGQTARMSVQFRCGVEYIGHEPSAQGDSLRIRLESSNICTGAAPGIARIREQHRPIGADAAKLVGIEYDGDSPTGQVLRFDFSEEVHFDAVRSVNDNTIMVQISLTSSQQPAARPTEGSTGRLVPRPVLAAPGYVINLESSQRPPATADVPALPSLGDKQVFVTQAMIDGRTWYRVRVGYFNSADDAARALREIRGRYPSAWIDRGTPDDSQPAGAALPAPVAATTAISATASDRPADATPIAADAKTGQLMDDARRAMIAGELSRAIQIYTKVLQLPPNEYQQDAQEFLALARERNGQIAHAKAEYQRYLSVYPGSEGAERVRQRLASLLASATSDAAVPAAAANAGSRQRAAAPAWNVNTFVSQFYRRDANQLNDEDQVVSQSSIYSDLSIDARRRGERFDFSTRLTGGHRYNLLDEAAAGGNDFRLSYAYVDVADARTRLRGRLGRQTRNSGGVLGRFDGLNLAYGLTERLQLEAVAGKPVYSTANAVDDERSFFGLSTNFGPIGENLDLRLYFLQQNIEGLTDRQTLGGELRYFGASRSLWSMVEYDTNFSEISSAFVQGSWRLPSKFTVTALVDHRQSPYLSLGNAIVGQPVEDFAQLKVFFTEDELHQFALDRSAVTNTVTLGLSKAMSPKLQLGLNATQSSVEATEASGGVPANPAAEYSYVSLDLVASSVFSERDVSIVSVRYSQSDTANVYTLNLDSRFSIGRAWRISPRLRIDYREIMTDASEQWSYTPGLRLDYRRGRKLRVELLAGKEFSSRQMVDSADQNRESYYVSAGYQWFF
jgi:SPOR domain